MKSTERSERLSTRVKNWIYRHRYILALSFGFFVATFILSLFYPQLADEASHRIRMQFILEHGRLPFDDFEFNLPKAYKYPPLFHILGALSKYLFGFYTLLPAFMGGASIFLTYKLVSLWYNRRLAVLSSIGLACIPQFFLFSARYRVETTITAGFLLSYYLYFLYRKEKKRKYLYMAFVTAGILSAVKTYGVIAPTTIALHMFWENRQRVWKAFKNNLMPFICGGLLALIWPLRNFIRSGSLTKTDYSYVIYTSNIGGIFLFVPTMKELTVNWAAAILGLNPPDLIWDLGMFHQLLPYLWFILPISLFAFIIYGAVEEKDNSFIWIWAVLMLLAYEAMRIKTSVLIEFKSRHFITLFPMLGLFAARAYQNINWRKSLKVAFFVILVVGMMGQMLAGATIRAQFANTHWPPVVDFVEENVEKDEIIFGGGRNLAAQVKGYKIIQEAYKPGYINPDKPLKDEITKADWVLIPDRSSERLDRRKKNLQNLTNVELVRRIDAYRNMPYGRIGQTWWIYKVKKD